MSRKISQLTRDLSPALTDILPTVKSPDSSPLSRATSLSSVFNLFESDRVGVTVQAYDADILKSDESDELTVGFTSAPHSIGVVSSGTVTPSFANGNMQTLTNNGTFTLAPPSSGSGTIIVQMTNGASAGTVTTSGFIPLPGDSLGTLNGNKYILQIIKFGSNTYLQISAAGDNS
jgi:hypothetical protein